MAYLDLQFRNQLILMDIMSIKPHSLLSQLPLKNVIWLSTTWDFTEMMHYTNGSSMNIQSI